MLRNHYNILLKRYKDAEVLMNNPNIPLEKKIKSVSKLKTITDRLGILLESIKDYTEEEALNGFAYEDERSV